MYLVVGLGNPEEDYKNTRHNMGVEAVNKIAEKLNVQIEKKKFNGLYENVNIEDKKILLLKPQTYMNLSGNCISDFVDFYKIPIENIIVIHDDVDIDEGKIKIRKCGGPGTHNGMKSVCTMLSSESFPRIRIGIGKPEYKEDLINYVLGYIDDKSKEILDKATTLAAEATIEIMKNGIDVAMNKFN